MGRGSSEHCVVRAKRRLASIREAEEGADHSSGWCKRVLGKADPILLLPSP